MPESVQGYLRLEASEFMTDGIVYEPIVASLIQSQDRITRVLLLVQRQVLKIIIVYRIKLDFILHSNVCSILIQWPKKYLDTLKCSLNK